MRAIQISEFGDPDQLTITDVDDPQPTTGEVLVDVVAAGVNYMDIYARMGRPPYAGNLPFTLGAEGAGTVTEIGANVSDTSVGDRVAWTGVPGSYADRVVVPADRVVPVPDDVSLEVAAATLLQGGTAHYLATSTYPISDGDVAVVHAGAGGVGLLLTQIIVKRGGRVIATVSGGADGDKAKLAREAGAAHVVDYGDLLDTVAGVTAGAGAHVVYDGVGQATFDDSLKALRRRGLLVLYGAASGPVPNFDLTRLSRDGSLFVTRPTMADYVASREELLSRTNDLFAWIADGSLSVRIGATYALADAARAHEDLAARRTSGKLLLTI